MREELGRWKQQISLVIAALYLDSIAVLRKEKYRVVSWDYSLSDTHSDMAPPFAIGSFFFFFFL